MRKKLIAPSRCCPLRCPGCASGSASAGSPAPPQWTVSQGSCEGHPDTCEGLMKKSMDYIYEPPWWTRAAVNVYDRFLPHVEPDRPGRVARVRGLPLRRCWYWSWVGGSFRVCSWHHRNFCLLQDFEETLLCGLTNSKYGEASNLERLWESSFWQFFDLSKVGSSFKLIHIFTRKHMHAWIPIDQSSNFLRERFIFSFRKIHIFF